MPRNHISVMLGLGWSFFFLGWLLNLAYYKLHPNMVDFDTSRRLGRVYTGPRGWCDRGEEGGEETSQTSSIYQSP